MRRHWSVEMLRLETRDFRVSKTEIRSSCPLLHVAESKREHRYQLVCDILLVFFFFLFFNIADGYIIKEKSRPE